MTEILDLTKLSPAQLAQLQRILAAGLPVAPEGPDYSKLEAIYVCHNAEQPHAFKLSDVTDNASRVRIDKAECPTCGAKLGHAPIAVNGKQVESPEHAAALRVSDSKVVAYYHSPSAEQEASKDDEETEPNNKPTVKTGGKR